MEHNPYQEPPKHPLIYGKYAPRRCSMASDMCAYTLECTSAPAGFICHTDPAKSIPEAIHGSIR